MFTNLPEEIERYIWKIYFSETVMSQVKDKKTIWFQPSNEILKICNEVGCLQHRHSDLEKLLFDDFNEEKKKIHQLCFQRICNNCKYYGFPCANATFYGGFDERLQQYWKI